MRWSRHRWEERWTDTRIHGTTKRWDGRYVRLLYPRLLREHLRQQRGGHRIKDEDRPSQTPLVTEQLLHRAERAGRHIGALCQGMHRVQGAPAVRRHLEWRPHSPLSLRQVDPLSRSSLCTATSSPTKPRRRTNHEPD